MTSSGKHACAQGCSLRFREAVPDYVLLLTERTRLPLEPFENACFARWSDRWASRLVSSLTPDEIQSYFAELAQKEHASREIEREKSLVRWFYRWGLRCGWTNVDPTLDLERTRTLPDHRMVTWTSFEQRRLLDACRGVFPQPEARSLGHSASDPQNISGPMRKPPMLPPYLHPLVLLGVRTGLRLGHLINLEWSQVDLKSGRISIPASDVKSGCAIDIGIDGDSRCALVDLLRLARKASTPPLRVFDAAGLPLWRDRPDEHAVLHVFRRVRKHAGIPEGDFNSLRLTFARNCWAAGVPISHPLRVGDWDDSKLVLKVYEEAQQRAIHVLDSTAAPPSGPHTRPGVNHPAKALTGSRLETGSETEIIPIEDQA